MINSWALAVRTEFHMIKMKIIVTLLAALLVGCSAQPNLLPRAGETPATPQPLAIGTPTVLETHPTPAFAQLRFNIDQLAKLETNRFSLYLVGLAIVDSNELFIYGDLESFLGGNQQSIVLKSEDHGLTWNEVFEPINHNSVLFVSFINRDQGRLLCAWTVETVNDLKLYKTTDGGKHWAFVSKIPMWQWYGSPSRMQFLTPDYGEMDLVYIGGAPGTDKISFLSTSDGGATWWEKLSLPTDSQNFSVYDAYRRTVPSRFISFGADESIWLVNDRRVNDSSYELQVLMSNSAEWHSVSRIADDYTFIDGQVSITK